MLPLHYTRIRSLDESNTYVSVPRGSSPIAPMSGRLLLFGRSRTRTYEDPKAGKFTVSSNCHYATRPFINFLYLFLIVLSLTPSSLPACTKLKFVLSNTSNISMFSQSTRLCALLAHSTEQCCELPPLVEVSASCSMQLVLQVSTGYPRSPYGS